MKLLKKYIKLFLMLWIMFLEILLLVRLKILIWELNWVIDNWVKFKLKERVMFNQKNSFIYNNMKTKMIPSFNKIKLKHHKRI